MAAVRDMIAELSSHGVSHGPECQFCGTGQAGVMQTLRYNGTQFFVFRRITRHNEVSDDYRVVSVPSTPEVTGIFSDDEATICDHCLDSVLHRLH